MGRRAVEPPPECCPDGSSTARRPIRSPIHADWLWTREERMCMGGCGGESRTGAFYRFWEQRMEMLAAVSWVGGSFCL